MRSLVISVFLYACESWTLTAELEKRTQAFEEEVGRHYQRMDRTAENGTRWETIVANSSLVPRHLPRLWIRIEFSVGSIIFFEEKISYFLEQTFSDKSIPILVGFHHPLIKQQIRQIVYLWEYSGTVG